MKKRARIVSGLAAIAALFLAPTAEASITRSSAPSREASAPSLTLAAPEPSEFSLFDGTEIARALASRPAFDLISITTDDATTAGRARFVSPSELSADELPEGPELVPITSVREQRFNLQLSPGRLRPRAAARPARRRGELSENSLPGFRTSGNADSRRAARRKSRTADGDPANLGRDLHLGPWDGSPRIHLGDRDSPNLYGFVGGRPHEATDPMGLCLGLDNVPCWDYLAEVPSFLGQTAKDTAKVAAAGAAGVVVGAGVVAAAAVSAPVVVAGAAAAAITYGVVKATEAGINRWGAGQSVTRAAVGGVGDVTGASALVAGVADRDIATGQKLNLTHDQKIKALQGGAFALGAIYGGGKAAETLDFSGLTGAAGRGLNEGLTVPRGPTGNVYSVAFETAIPKRGIGTRDSHFQAANEAALRAQRDPEVADAFASLGISIPVDSEGAVMGRSPAGWTWHHVTEQPGVMRLVPRGQHQGKAWQDVLHPKMDGRRVGGFKLWGADY